jgi:UDP-N-acetylmuramate dehydrogenase
MLTSLREAAVDRKPSALLADYTTFRLGGPCRFLITCQNPEQLETTVGELIESKQKFILIGGGSNLVVSDEGVDAVVLRYVSPWPLILREGTDLIVSGSTQLDHLVKSALQCGLEGVNYASGIPGTVGGAIVGNAGAFGRQVGDHLLSVCLLTKDGTKKEVEPSSLDFRYRHSNLKETGHIVLSARFAMRPGDPSKLQQERLEILKLREEKHPNLKLQPCAGSFFRNIEPTSLAERRQAAGWFLEQAGVKKFRVGGAVIFEKHANIIIKSNGCRSQNVYELSHLMAQAVKEKFGLDLIREVRLVGRFKGMPEKVNNMIW